MQQTILLFGQLKEICSGDTVVVEGANDTNELQQKLFTKYPAMENAKFAIAVNRKLVTTNTVLDYSSEIALLPPFSGG